MNSAHEARLFNQGCFVVIAVVAILGACAYYVHTAFVWPIIGIIFGWIGFCSIKTKKDNKRLAEAYDSAFETFPGPRPELKKGDSYGYPSFTLHFKTKDQMEQAAASGHTDTFKASVKELFGYGGFDVEKGFGTTYEGWISDYMDTRKVGTMGITDVKARQRQNKTVEATAISSTVESEPTPPPPHL